MFGKPVFEAGFLSCYGMILKCANVRQNNHKPRKYRAGRSGTGFRPLKGLAAGLEL